ncbi:MAG TPA: hypothetical protein VMK66_04550 [Myxococcales bacterium]|nr:hypothetical protein [Myxococcales bacterium]
MKAARWCVLAAAALSCARSAATPPDPRQIDFPQTAAVKVSPAAGGGWLLLFEALQAQALITTPVRSAGLLDAGGEIVRRFAAPQGWILIDAAAHPSGDVSLLSLRVDPAAEYPLRVLVSRFLAGGGLAGRELSRLLPPEGPEAGPAFLASLDRARIVASGEDLLAVVRWANNAVQVFRLDGQGLEQRWAAWVEPAAPLFFLGIIGGGFDNFHQGDSAFFVYPDVDGQGDLHVAVASTEEVLRNHDAFFGESLTARADPASFDFGVAVVTRITAQGERSPASLLGMPGRGKRLLNLKMAGDSVILVGRIRTGDAPDGWDGWLLSSRADTAQVDFERAVDVQGGDMFWDVAALEGGRILAVGSTNYTQNPQGLSVSDARDPLALVLDPQGKVEQRILLPSGPAGRGNEAISASVGSGGEMAICGVQNAPGTHAAVFSDAFLVVRGTDPF